MLCIGGWEEVNLIMLHASMVRGHNWGLMPGVLGLRRESHWDLIDIAFC
jgi:hypothetical protein